MALVSELVERLAAVQGINPGSLALMARFAREAGHISQAGRGRGAAKATISDAAKLYAVCSLTENPKDTVEAIRIANLMRINGISTPQFEWKNSIGGLSLEEKLSLKENNEPKFILEFFKNITFIEALEILFKCMGGDDFFDFILSMQYLGKHNLYESANISGYDFYFEKIVNAINSPKKVLMFSSFQNPKWVEVAKKEREAILGYEDLEYISEDNKKKIVLNYVNLHMKELDELNPNTVEWVHCYNDITEIFSGLTMEVSVTTPSNEAQIIFKKDVDPTKPVNNIYTFKFSTENSLEFWIDRETRRLSTHLTFLKIGRMIGYNDV